MGQKDKLGVFSVPRNLNTLFFLMPSYKKITLFLIKSTSRGLGSFFFFFVFCFFSFFSGSLCTKILFAFVQIMPPIWGEGGGDLIYENLSLKLFVSSSRLLSLQLPSPCCNDISLLFYLEYFNKFVCNSSSGLLGNIPSPLKSYHIIHLVTID